MKLRYLFGLLAILQILSAECQVGDDVLNLLAKAEKHPQRKMGYPYIISFNNTRDARFLRGKFKKLDSRTIDCFNQENCVAILKDIKNKGVTNLDLGAFQINMSWHKYRADRYFDFKESSKIACKILMEIVEKERVWNWNVLAAYHSRTKEHNERYKNRLIRLRENR